MLCKFLLQYSVYLQFWRQFQKTCMNNCVNQKVSWLALHQWHQSHPRRLRAFLRLPVTVILSQHISRLDVQFFLLSRSRARNGRKRFSILKKNRNYGGNVLPHPILTASFPNKINFASLEIGFAWLTVTYKTSGSNREAIFVRACLSKKGSKWKSYSNQKRVLTVLRFDPLRV